MRNEVLWWLLGVLPTRSLLKALSWENMTLTASSGTFTTTLLRKD